MRVLEVREIIGVTIFPWNPLGRRVLRKTSGKCEKTNVHVLWRPRPAARMGDRRQWETRRASLADAV